MAGTVNVKATTSEEKWVLWASEGIAAMAICLLGKKYYFKWGNNHDQKKFRVRYATKLQQVIYHIGMLETSFV